VSGPSRSSSDPVPRPALWLGMAGLIPFAVAGLGVWLAAGQLAGFLHTALIAYALAIASFMAGAQWGFGAAAALDDRARLEVLATSVVPCLVAWAGVFAPFPWPYAFLLAAFALVLRFDLALVRDGLAPGWYPLLRLPLSAAVAVALLSGLIHGLVAGL
jgi:hypothetical protein